MNKSLDTKRVFLFAGFCFALMALVLIVQAHPIYIIGGAAVLWIFSLMIRALFAPTFKHFNDDDPRFRPPQNP